MKNWRKVLISESTPIREAIKIIDEGALQIALVVDNNERLLGTITDGDIRRGILKGIALENTAARIMNSNPTVAHTQDSRDEILKLLRQKSLHQLPVLDHEGHLVGLEVIEDLVSPQARDNLVVIMAGGLGIRLKQLTSETPKPLLKVGEKPILETILHNFIDQGFRRFYISVNYKSEMIESHFGDGSRWGVKIDYLREDQKLGTAGALGLLPKRPNDPVLVMNGDVLTKVNFQQLLDFHLKHKAEATMCVREYDFQVPYGVVKLNKHRISSIEEKPVQRFFVNAGIYVLQPEVLDLIPNGSPLDMPPLFDRLIALEKETVVFPVREYWVDIGKLSDYEQANGEFNEVFG